MRYQTRSPEQCPPLRWLERCHFGHCLLLNIDLDFLCKSRCLGPEIFSVPNSPIMRRETVRCSLPWAFMAPRTVPTTEQQMPTKAIITMNQRIETVCETARPQHVFDSPSGCINTSSPQPRDLQLEQHQRGKIPQFPRQSRDGAGRKSCKTIWKRVEINFEGERQRDLECGGGLRPTRPSKQCKSII